jgi:hypothetical protein
MKVCAFYKKEKIITKERGNNISDHRNIVENDALVSAIDEQLMSLKKEKCLF